MSIRERAPTGEQRMFAAELKESDGPSVEAKECRMAGCHVSSPGALFSTRHATEAMVSSPAGGESAATSSKGFLPETGNLFIFPSSCMSFFSLFLNEVI